MDPSAELPIESIVAAPVTVEELDLAFLRDYPPDIAYALNEVKRSRLSYEVSSKVACAYSMCEEKNPAWSPVIYESNLVRVNMLDVLVQAKNQGIDFSDHSDFREDALLYLIDKNPMVVQRALMILAFIDDPRDVASIEDIARTTTNDVTFRMSIVALKLMSSDRARDAIQDIFESSTESKRAVIAEFFEN